MNERHAEIAGAGIVGLGTASLLARSGWSVRMHERSSELREVGAAIGIRGAGLEVLRQIGVVERLGGTTVLDREEKRDFERKASSRAKAHRGNDRVITCCATTSLD